MEINLPSIFYLFYRLAPFILVSYFVLGSIINGEPKGFIYLVGLVFTCVMTVGMMSVIGESVANTTPVCENLKIGSGTIISDTPMSMVIFSFTFFYLLFPIAKYHLELTNIPMLIFFPLIILGDIYWNMYFNCFSMVNVLIALIMAGGVGLFYSFLIDKTRLPSLQYYNVGSNRERCAMATKNKYKCTTYKADGTPLTTTTKSG